MAQESDLVKALFTANKEKEANDITNQFNQYLKVKDSEDSALPTINRVAGTQSAFRKSPSQGLYNISRLINNSKSASKEVREAQK